MGSGSVGRNGPPYDWNQRCQLLVHFSKLRLIEIKILTRSSAIAVIGDRTACSISTLFIVIATSRPLNKKSVRCHCQSADPTITTDLHPQSAVHGCSPQSAQAAVARPGGRPSRTVHGTVSLLQRSRFPCARVAA